MDGEINEYEMTKLVGDFYLVVADLGNATHITSCNHRCYCTKFSEGLLSAELLEWEDGIALDDFLNSIRIFLGGCPVYSANVHRADIDLQINVVLDDNGEWIDLVRKTVEEYHHQEF